MTRIADIADYRAEARRRLPRVLFDYIDGGSFSERTLARNEADFDSFMLRQRVLVDTRDISLGIDLFGQSLSMPLILAPVGLAGMFARRGEVQAAQAAARENIPLTLSTMSVCGLEEVRQRQRRRPGSSSTCSMTEDCWHRCSAAPKPSECPRSC